jgi:uncharacterized membrane protein
MCNHSAGPTDPFMISASFLWARHRLHALFEATLLLKGILASLELLSGLGLWLIGNDQVIRFANWMTVHEVAESPHDPLVRWSVNALDGFSVERQHFFAIYLCAHGLLKLTLVILLARRVRWAFPVGMIMLAGFVVWQLNQWAHSPDIFLILISALDSLMIWLIWREWGAMPPLHSKPLP